MLRETETEETIGFLSYFYHWWHFNWGGAGLLNPLATPKGGDELSLKNGTIKWLRLLTMLLTGRIYIARGPRHFGEFCKVFLPNLGEDQKKSLTIRKGGPWHSAICKSAPGYYIMSIKSLHDDLRYQLLGQKPLISPGFHLKLSWQKLN